MRWHHTRLWQHYVRPRKSILVCSGFHSCHTTETSVLSGHNDQVHSIDSGQVASLVLIDVSSPFNIIDQGIFLTILANLFSVSDTAIDWFPSHITDHSQSSFHNYQWTGPVPVVGRSSTDRWNLSPTWKTSSASLLRYQLCI
jgi:hypothetical protein